MNKSKSTLFLMELIIVILFFSLSAAVCIRIFVHAHQLERSTESTGYGVLWAGNAAELFYEYDDNNIVENLLMEAYKQSADYADTYHIVLSFSEKDSLRLMRFTFVDTAAQTSVYSFTFEKHIQEVASNG